MSESTRDNLKKFIITYTNDVFQRNGTGVLFSQLGTLIATEHPELRDSLKGRTLADFIEKEMDDTIQIIFNPEQKNLKIALPVGVNVKDVMSFIPKRNTINTETRYNSTFWAAFSKPLNDGYIRLIEFEPELRFEDVLNVNEIDLQSKKIISADSINQSAELPTAQTSQAISLKIKKWLSENDVPLNYVKAKNMDSKVLKAEGSKSLLEDLMLALDESELKRIQIPLDIVAKLHRKR